MAMQTNPASLPPQGYTRAKDLLPYVPFGLATLWNWSKQGKFPAPVKISPTITAWRNSEVIAWLENLNQPEMMEG